METSSARLPLPSAQAHMRDHIFVSYSSKDRGFVDRLADDLRTRGYTVWVDFENIQGGARWKQSIADSLHASAVILAVLSPDSIQSEWVEIELKTAFELGKTVVPLLLRPLPEIASIKLPTIQEVCREIHYRDFTKGYQPAFDQLLTDLPTAESGVPGHCKKLIAKLASQPWGLDHYIQEEARLLPLDASPYEDSAIQGQRENLMRRLWESHRLILLGEPGMGKTVALERMAWEVANHTPPILPVMISLFEYDGQPLLEWIRVHLAEYGEIRLSSLDETRTFLHDLSYDCYFLLDGLNEVRPAHQAQILGEITRLGTEYARHRLIVTSRVQDNGWRQLRRGTQMEQVYLIQPIHYHQAQTYLNAHLGESDGQALWTQLDERMQGLATTPLLLWLIKEAWLEARQQRQGVLHMPDNRGQLYYTFVSRMLQRDDDRRLNHSVPEPVRSKALERLALAMQKDETIAISRDAALELLGDQTIIDALLVNGLLRLANDQLRFAPHQTLQEHFAARALRPEAARKVRTPKLVRRVWRGVLKYADDPRWAETFIQLAGLVDDPNTLARALAEINPWLAWWCVQEGRKVDEATERAIRAKSEALIQSGDVQDRRRAAQTLGRLFTPRVVEPLVRLAIDEDEEVGSIANRALQGFGDTAAQALATTLDDDSVAVLARLRVGSTLARMGDPRSGVGTGSNGLPDIVWCKVPAGPMPLGGDEKAFESWPLQPSVHLPYTFWLAQYPLTYAQFEVFVQADGYNARQYWTEGGWEWKQSRETPDFWDDPMWHISNYPVIGVTWYEADAYAHWLTASYQLQGKQPLPEIEGDWVIRLPTEDEWEKAARYPDGRVYPWGDVFATSQCNTQESGIGRTTPVGIFPAGKQSNTNMCDLAGNVWEWCLPIRALASPDFLETPASETSLRPGFDSFSERPTQELESDIRERLLRDLASGIQPEEQLSNPVRKPSLTLHESFALSGNETAVRPLRGGSWSGTSLHARAATRNAGEPAYNNSHVGFRVCLGPSRRSFPWVE